MVMNVKFTTADDNLTRKATFDRAPTWETLATKVEVLCKIPSYEVGLSYIDNEGDSVTISTDEELTDFYVQNTNTKNVKFTVQRLVRRAQSVDQVPEAFENDGESPETIILEERDWDGGRRVPEVPLGAIPMFDAMPINPMFAFMATDAEARAGTPAYSEARIEEIPSGAQSRSQSIADERDLLKNLNNQNNSNSNNPFGRKNGRGNVGGQQQQQPNRGKGKGPTRRMTDLSTVESMSETTKDPRSQFNVNAAARESDSISSEAGSDVEDPALPPLPRTSRNRNRKPAPANPNVLPPSLYNDLAGVIAALTNVMNRAADGSYLQPPLENAQTAARAAIEDSARKVTESLEGVLRNIGQQVTDAARFNTAAAAEGNTPAGERPNLRRPTSSTGRPRPWSMFNNQFFAGDASVFPPSFVGGPSAGAPRQESPFQSGGIPTAPESRIPPFVPPLAQHTPFVNMNGQQLPTSRSGGSNAPRPVNSERSGAFPMQFRPPSGPPPPQARSMQQQQQQHSMGMDAYQSAQEANNSEELQAERERLDSARQLYKQEKANFRAQREAERMERAQRKARREKGGPEMNQLAESLEAAFGNQMQPPEEVQVPQPIRPNDLPELFSPPTQSTLMGGGGQDNQNPALNLSPWDHPQLPQPPPWTRPARGPNHEQNQRLINRLSDMGFTAASHPQIANVVKQQTRNNLTKSDDEIIERVLEVLISGDGSAPAAGPSSGRRR